jgi:cytochrome c peroxidase
MVSFVAVIGLGNSPAAGAAGVETPAPLARLELTRLATDRGTAPAFSVTLSDAGNHAWSIEGTSNQVDWFEVAAVKVHNGWYSQAVAEASGPAFFYRAMQRTTGPVPQSTVAEALRLPAMAYNYAAPLLPPAFLQPPIVAQDNTPIDNPVTNPGATLGRVLFYDKRLSKNQTVACASCHQQRHGFSDPRTFSVGFEGGLTGRNSMGLAHARWYQRRSFFWDERAATLEAQVLQPILNPVEMGLTLELLTNRVATEPYYTNLFIAAFGTPSVTTNRISRALAQFVRSIVSVGSKYDQGVATGFANFTAEENLGRRIFLGQVGNATCAACHGTDNFVPGPALNNNGLEFPYVDLGVGGVTGNPADNGKFKVPSLRNIGLTAPYMHDGRFATLEQVVEFYNSGVVDNPNLSPPLRNPPGTPNAGQPRRLNLTAQQKSALVAFLKTLDDPALATDPKYADPFNYGP